MTPAQTTVLFDGHCNLCNGAVDFIVRHDPGGRFRFASLQSDKARDLLAEHGRRTPTGGPETIVLIEDGRVYERSDAVVRIARGLSGPARAAAALRILPRPARDLLYKGVARSRYRLFGRRETCRVPTPAERARFL